MSDNKRLALAGKTVDDLLAKITELREAVRVLAEDKIHGVADMVSGAVVANPIALAAIEKARAT